jgi:hypothetical protein
LKLSEYLEAQRIRRANQTTKAESAA